jgi:hypothetical protein
VLCIQHGMENGGRISWERKKSSVSINAEKTNNAPNNVERYKVPRILLIKKICVVHILGGISTIKQMKNWCETIMTNDFKMIVFKQLTICTTLQHHCTTFSFASGYTEVLQGGTISMPTGRLQHYVIKFFCGFLRVLRFPPKLTTTK